MADVIVKILTCIAGLIYSYELSVCIVDHYICPQVAVVGNKVFVNRVLLVDNLSLNIIQDHRYSNRVIGADDRSIRGVSWSAYIESLDRFNILQGFHLFDELGFLGL